jgi:hypothetical protein
MTIDQRVAALALRAGIRAGGDDLQRIAGWVAGLGSFKSVSAMQSKGFRFS